MKSDKEGEISYDISYMRNLKINDTNKLIYKIETDSQTENEAMVARGRMGEGLVMWEPKGVEGRKKFHPGERL